MNGFVYKLINPLSNEIIYIGCTTRSIKERHSEHLALIKSSNADLYKYCRENSIVPVVDLVEEVRFNKISTLYKRERFWIEKLRTPALANSSLLKVIIKNVFKLKEQQNSIQSISNIVRLTEDIVDKILRKEIC